MSLAHERHRLYSEATTDCVLSSGSWKSVQYSRYTGASGTQANYLDLGNGQMMHLYVDGRVQDAEKVLEHVAAAASSAPKRFNGVYVLAMPTLGPEGDDIRRENEIIAARGDVLASGEGMNALLRQVSPLPSAIVALHQLSQTPVSLLTQTAGGRGIPPPQQRPTPLLKPHEPLASDGALSIVVEAHIIDARCHYSSNRTEENARRILQQAAQIWGEQAGIYWHLNGIDKRIVNGWDLEELFKPPYSKAKVSQWPNCDRKRIHINFVRALVTEIKPQNAKAYRVKYERVDQKGYDQKHTLAKAYTDLSMIFIADYFGDTFDFIALARQVGYLLGLKKRSGLTNLMSPGSNGKMLSPEEVKTARANAIRFQG